MAETLTLNTKVTYKRRRNPRCLRVWESDIANTAMVHAAEVVNRIQQESEEHDLDIHSMGKTLIPTDVLYLIADSYLVAYKSLLGEDLLKTGNTNKTNPNIH